MGGGGEAVQQEEDWGGGGAGAAVEDVDAIGVDGGDFRLGDWRRHFVLD